jgi:hypothetical protein
VVLVQDDHILDGPVLVVVTDDHELKLEVQRHTGGSLRGKGPATVSALVSSRQLAPPSCHALVEFYNHR